MIVSRWQSAGGKLLGGRWQMTCGSRHMTGGMWPVLMKLEKFSIGFQMTNLAIIIFS